MIRNNGLSIVLLSLFLVSFGGQAIAGWRTHNDDQIKHGQSPVTFGAYLGTGHFWEATGENWESEFLQMAMFVLLTTVLYQKGSAESKRLDVTEDVDLDPRRFQDAPDVPSPVRRGGAALRWYAALVGPGVYRNVRHLVCDACCRRSRGVQQRAARSRAACSYACVICGQFGVLV